MSLFPCWRQARLRGLSAALLVALALPAAAAPEAPAAPAKGAPPSVDQPTVTNQAPIDRNHPLSGGDVIEIQVAGVEDLTRSVRLFADGSFDFPFIGEVKAGGVTVSELAARLKKGLESELRNPKVTVILREVYVAPRPAEIPKVTPRITVLGAVSRKGLVELPEPRWLRAVLQESGPTERADLGAIRLRYPDGTQKNADFSQFAAQGFSRDDVLLKGGEEVIVLERPLPPAIQKPEPVRLTVLGQVNKAGTIEVDPDANILDVLEKAGGTKQGANLETVEVRSTAGAEKPRVVNVEKFIDGDTKDAYRPRPGDKIVVPLNPLKVFVFGEVSKQGPVDIKQEERVFELFLRVTALPTAEIEKAQLIRRRPDGKPLAIPVNLRQIMKEQPNAGNNPLLLPGDALFIPRKKQNKGPLYYLTALTSPFFLFRNMISPVGGATSGGF